MKVNYFQILLFNVTFCLYPVVQGCTLWSSKHVKPEYNWERWLKRQRFSLQSYLICDIQFISMCMPYLITFLPVLWKVYTQDHISTPQTLLGHLQTPHDFAVPVVFSSLPQQRRNINLAKCWANVKDVAPAFSQVDVSVFGVCGGLSSASERIKNQMKRDQLNNSSRLFAQKVVSQWCYDVYPVRLRVER